MKNVVKLVSSVVFISMISFINAQQTSQAGVGIVLEMKPVLQLDITSPDQINFVFNDKQAYAKGITKKSATIIKVTSTTKWDLYAVGRSMGTSPNGKTFWDQEKSYGSSVNSVADLPLSLLELRQSRTNSKDANATSVSDYSSAFSTTQAAATGSNSLFVNDDGSATPPLADNKYIAGHAGTTADDSMTAGTYLNNSGTSSDFYYVMDYRIMPGLPAIFPNAFAADSTTAEDIATVAAAGAGTGAEYAEGGVYTMYVQYVLLEDQ